MHDVAENSRVVGRVQRIKACLNGGRAATEHPGVPVSAADLAAAAAAAVAAGAEAVHIHPRDGSGAQSLAAADVGAAVAAIRKACPGVPVGVTTGIWVSGGDSGNRQRAVAAWAGLSQAARPDFASVNVAEPGGAELTEALHRAGIGIEAGVSTVDDAKALAAGALPGGLLRILVEVAGPPADSAPARAEEILAVLDAAALPARRLVHGEGKTCWPLVEHAGRLGLPTRIGLEDVTAGPDGEPVASNAELVTRALRIWEAGRS